MAAKNLPTYFLDASETRDSEYPGTPFQDVAGDGSYDTYKGCNRAGSNAPGIGINTGGVNPKIGDWPAQADTAPAESQHIGKAGDDLNVIDGTDLNNELAFVQADAQTANLAVADAATGGVNRTGATVEADDWLWSVIPVA